MMNKFDVIVIGAGPAGMMAAATAAEGGVSVAVIDKNRQQGKKLLITGKGRCNVTNNSDSDTFFANIAVNKKFLLSAYSSFTSKDTMDFFTARRVPLKTERGGRVFPVSDNSSDINNALISCCKERGVKFFTAAVAEIVTDSGAVTAVKTEEGEFYCSSCVLAAGGKSYPVTGSDGSGYELAKALGHTVVKPKPSLVPLVCEGKMCSHMQGLSLKNVALTVKNQEGKTEYTDFGELLFTHFGLSGPVILSASSHMSFEKSKRYTVSIDLKPALSHEQLDARILRDFSENINKNFANSLGGLLPRKIISTIIERSGIDRNEKVNSITKESRQRLVSAIKSFDITAIGFRPIEEAIITSGGVSVKEISPKTMESKLIKGLYFAGEIIDVDAHTGGFNLQIAFCTGFCAGKGVLSV
jgi:predicted Rossmann fold flavoprotein